LRLEKDPQRVRELALQKEEENWRYRAALKNTDLSCGQIDAIVRKIYRAVSEQIDCLECGHCCREMVPVLKAKDVARLSKRLGLRTAEIKKRYLKDSEEGDGSVFTLTACPFQDGNACSVYDDRPDVCRSFPHLHKKDFVFRLSQVVENCEVYRIVYNVYEQL
jgi:Fe-S-cluster containining protein